MIIVLQIIRHADRAPIHEFTSPESAKLFPRGLGELTSVRNPTLHFLSNMLIYQICFRKDSAMRRNRVQPSGNTTPSRDYWRTRWRAMRFFQYRIFFVFFSVSIITRFFIWKTVWRQCHLSILNYVRISRSTFVPRQNEGCWCLRQHSQPHLQVRNWPVRLSKRKLKIKTIKLNTLNNMSNSQNISLSGATARTGWSKYCMIAYQKATFHIYDNSYLCRNENSNAANLHNSERWRRKGESNTIYHLLSKPNPSLWSTTHYFQNSILLLPGPNRTRVSPVQLQGALFDHWIFLVD